MQTGASGSTYEETLQAQGLALRRLRAQRGNPSYNRIAKRAVEIFGAEAALPPATQSAAFNGRFVGIDRLMWLVRTLLSWNEFGEECLPPDLRAPALQPWRDRWSYLAEVRKGRKEEQASPGTRRDSALEALRDRAGFDIDHPDLLSERADEISKIMAQLYLVDNSIHALLDRVDFPRTHRQTLERALAAHAWNRVLRLIHLGAVTWGPAVLVFAALEDYPGNRELQLLAREARSQADRWSGPG
ncbi:effector-associated domain EAD1-containing protein [Streptomyces sp. NPDC049915]|uniref:effector-associated domain EAD1-containing protein n=1 Tax=Streptomyces sp. NPDC049915 TaxID=3155510 RepID=UPI0034274244